MSQPETIVWFKPEMTGGELLRLAGVLDRKLRSLEFLESMLPA